MSVASVISYIDAIAPESALLFTPKLNSILVGAKNINQNLIDTANKPVLSENSTYLCALDILLASNAVPPTPGEQISIDATPSSTLKITLVDGAGANAVNKYIAIPVMGTLSTDNNRLTFSFILDVGTSNVVSSILIDGELDAVTTTNIIYFGGGADNLVFTKI